MAFGVMESGGIDSWEDGIFPRTEELAETLHYFCYMPYASVHNNILDKTVKYDCPFSNHFNRKCFITDDSEEQTALDLAEAIIDANDTERYEDAWNYVGKALSMRGEK